MQGKDRHETSGESKYSTTIGPLFDRCIGYFCERSDKGVAESFRERCSNSEERIVRIIHGERDFAAKEEDLLPFYAQLKTHDKRYILFPDGGTC
jgi:hypothetical protein